MKNRRSDQPQPARQSAQPARCRRTTFPLCLTLLAAFLVASLMAQGENILVNPGFEASPVLTGWLTRTTEAWSINGASTQGQLYRTGANALWTQGLYGNGDAPRYYNMYAYQKIAAAPGSTYTADAWFSEYSSYYLHQGGDNEAGSGLLTSDADGAEDCWVEVQFLDSANQVLADYKSAIISPIDVTLPGSAGVQTINVYDWPTVTNVIPGVATNIYLQWIHCQVTNVFDIGTIGPNTDPATESVTNTLSGDGLMTAPPGTAYVQYMLCLAQALYESGANYWDDCTLIQVGGPLPSVISGLSPDGTKFFNTNTSLSFNVTSASAGGAPLPTNPIDGIKVIVNGVDQSASLQFGGAPTALTVTLPNSFTSNSLYNVSITVSNSAGFLTTVNPVFDTFTSVFIVPVETFDYDKGQFIQNPIPTSTNYVESYFGRAGSFGIDMWTYNGSGVLTGGSTLAPDYPNRTDTNEAFEVASDIQLPLYAAANDPGVHNVNLSYNVAGNWFNYTRNPWPAGNYEVYARISGGQGAGAELLNIVTSGYGQPNPTTDNLGQFYLANGTDWTHYYWVPLTDSDGNLVAVNVPSGRQTLQLLSSPIAGVNVISFIFVPFPGSGVPPTISNIKPTNDAVLASTAAGFSFTVSAGSGGTPINNSGIHLSLNGADVTSGLSFSGSGPINVSYSDLSPNIIYTAVIAVTNTAGAGVFRRTTFDTMSTGNFYVKMTDFDYNGGEWDWVGNGLQPLAYYGNAGAIAGIDYSHPGGGGSYPFRSPGLATEAAQDQPLPGYSAGIDFDVGYFDAGDWGNYTRNYPAGRYFVYGRLAGYSLSAYLDRITGGWRTINQTTQRLGTWQANPNGWQNWAWVPLTDASLTAPVIVTLGGTNTLRVTSGGGVNANYFMFVPVQGIEISAAKSGNNIVISFPTEPAGSYRVFYRTGAMSGNWMLLATVPGDGTVKSVSDAATGSPRYYKVTSP